MKQVEVTILGQSYILGCPDGGESSLLEAVADVDREMSAIRDGGKLRREQRVGALQLLVSKKQALDPVCKFLDRGHDAPARGVRPRL